MLDRTWTVGKLTVSPRGSRTDGERPVEPCRIGEATRADGADRWTAGGWKLAYSRRRCLVVGWIGRSGRMGPPLKRRARLKLGMALHRFADRFAQVGPVRLSVPNVAYGSADATERMAEGYLMARFYSANEPGHATATAGHGAGARNLRRAFIR